MAVPVLTLSRQNLVTELKSLRSTYTNEHKTLDDTLTNNHHAYVMKEWGENKQLLECLAKLQELILKYDETTFTLTFNLNGCSGDAPTLDAQIPGSKVTLPSKGAMIPPDGKILYGWNTKADGTGKSYVFSSAAYIMPEANTTLYALLGPDPNYEESEE